jgi:tRNA threonylcarbamoyl adenosine modification protein (Sua5/YciO/YrdC/YwlC family)
LYNLQGINRIYNLKRQPLSKPFSIICQDLKNISEYARVGNYAYKVMKRLLPGPYTFVLEASRQVPKILQTRRRTVGLRVPDHPIALGLVKLLGHPIITTTAALPDGPVESDPYEIEIKFKPHLELVIDGGIVLPDPWHHCFIMTCPEVLHVEGDVSAFGEPWVSNLGRIFNLLRQ